MKKRGSALIWILVILVLVVIGVIAYVLIAEGDAGIKDLEKEEIVIPPSLIEEEEIDGGEVDEELIQEEDSVEDKNYTFRWHQITNDKSFDNLNPNIYKNKIVWERFYLGLKAPNSLNVYVYDIINDKFITFNESSDITQSSPSIFKNKIVFVHNNSIIHVYDLSTKEEVKITNDSFDQNLEPDIYEDKIVWASNRNANWNIYLYDLSLNKETQITSDPFFEGASQRNPSIYKNLVVWAQDRENQVPGPVINDIFVHDINTNVTLQVTDSPSYKADLTMYTDVILWSEKYNGTSEIVLYDVSLRKKSIVPRDALDNSNRTHPSMYGNYIVWSQQVLSEWGDKSNIYLYNYVLGTISEIKGDFKSVNPVIYGDTIAWVELRGGTPEIYRAQIL